MNTENWLEQLDLVGVSHDGIAGPVSEERPVLANIFGRDTAFLKTEEGWIPNFFQMMEFRRTLDLKIRSKAKTKLSIGILLTGEFLNPHSAGTIGSLIRCIDPGKVEEVHIVVKQGFRGLLILMPSPLLVGVS